MKDRTGRVAPITMPLSKAKPSLSERHRQSERSITVTNTELLSKLFEVIEKDGKKPNHDLHIRKLRYAMNLTVRCICINLHIFAYAMQL